MAKHRVDFLTDGVWNSLSADAPSVFATTASPFPIRRRKARLRSRKSSRDGRPHLRARLDRGLRAQNGSGRADRVDRRHHLADHDAGDVISYNPLDPIADQAVRRDIEMKVDPDRILADGTVSPDRQGGQRRARDRRDLSRRIRRALVLGPQSSSALGALGLRAADRRHVRRQAANAVPGLHEPVPRLSRSPGLEQQGRFQVHAHHEPRRLQVRALLQLREQSQEWKFVNDEIRQGRKLVRLLALRPSLPKGRETPTRRVLKSVLYRAAGWDY